MEGIKTYKDLEIYKESYRLTLNIYKLTKKYPVEEKYDMVSQMRRAVYSIPLNIAEGWGRKSKLEFKRFLKMSLGSCNELQVLIDLSKDLGYISEIEHEEIKKIAEMIGKKIYKTEEIWN